MKISTAANWKEHYLSKVATAWSWDKRSHTEILASIKRDVYDHPAWLKCPSWVRQKVWQASEMHLKAVYHRNVMWLFPPSDGGLPLPLSSLTESDRQLVFADKIAGHFYWMDCKTVRQEDGSIIDTFTPTLKIFS
jgi:hypothetical protein